ncbi:MAG: flavodoxin [Ruminococcus sp.]|nr:flavodoxin [Ruminococcus sp.]
MRFTSRSTVEDVQKWAESLDLTTKIDANKILILYFTRPETDGTDTVAGASRVVAKDKLYGNVQYVASLIQENTKGDLVQLKTVQEYPRTHEALLDFALDEQENNARPELATDINLENYDTVFIGYPIWWYDLPMPIYNFLEKYNLSGKTVIPFTVHGGSGFSDTIDSIIKLQPEANIIKDGYMISRNSVSNAKSEVISWLEKIGMKKAS